MLRNKRLLTLVDWFCIIAGSILVFSSIYFLGFSFGKGTVSLLQASLNFLYLFLGYYLALILHELGHAFFGKVTGFQIVALGLGKNHLIFEEGKWRFERRLVGQGVAAQYIGIKRDMTDDRTILMFSGGLIVHLTLSLLYILLALLLNTWDWFLPQILLNLGFLLLNAKPNGITDGAKILEMMTYPSHATYLYRELQHAAVIFTKPESANLADFVVEDVPLEAGIIIQTAYLNSIEWNILQGNVEMADEKVKLLVDFTENFFIKMQSDYQLFFIQLLQGQHEKARELAKQKSVKTMFKQNFAQVQIIKAFYEVECLKDTKSAKKSLEVAEKKMTMSHMLADEVKFYRELSKTIQEKISSN